MSKGLFRYRQLTSCANPDGHIGIKGSRYAAAGTCTIELTAAAGGWYVAQPRTYTVNTTAVVTTHPSQQFVVLNATGYVVAQRKAAVASKATGDTAWRLVHRRYFTRKRCFAQVGPWSFELVTPTVRMPLADSAAICFS